MGCNGKNVFVIRYAWLLALPFLTFLSRIIRFGICKKFSGMGLYDGKRKEGQQGSASLKKKYCYE